VACAAALRPRMGGRGGAGRGQGGRFSLSSRGHPATPLGPRPPAWCLAAACNSKAASTQPEPAAAGRGQVGAPHGFQATLAGSSEECAASAVDRRHAVGDPYCWWRVVVRVGSLCCGRTGARGGDFSKFVHRKVSITLGLPNLPFESMTVASHHTHAPPPNAPLFPVAGRPDNRLWLTRTARRDRFHRA